jgi:hypothetical protein
MLYATLGGFTGRLIHLKLDGPTYHTLCGVRPGGKVTLAEGKSPRDIATCTLCLKAAKDRMERETAATQAMISDMERDGLL